MSDRMRLLSLRAYEATQSGLSGVVLTYGEVITGWNEVVRDGALPDGANVRLWSEHGPPTIGAAEMAAVDGVYRFEAEWAPTQQGRDAREETLFLMSRGITPDVSLGFHVNELALGDALTEEERRLGADAAIIDATPVELSMVIEGAAPSAIVERAASMARIPRGAALTGGLAGLNRVLAVVTAAGGIEYLASAPLVDGAVLNSVSAAVNEAADAAGGECLEDHEALAAKVNAEYAAKEAADTGDTAPRSLGAERRAAVYKARAARMLAGRRTGC